MHFHYWQHHNIKSFLPLRHAKPQQNSDDYDDKNHFHLFDRQTEERILLLLLLLLYAGGRTLSLQ